MSRKKDPSLLYDPELSMSEEQLRREIDEINKEIGSIRVEELKTPITRYTRRDSGIASSRRTDERPRQSNVSSFDMGARAKTPTYKVVDSMDSEDENDDLGIRDRYVSQRKKSQDFKTKNIVKPAPYDGKGPWIDYKSHFDACAQINEWSQKEKGLYLAVSLRGQAQGVLGNLPLELRQNYKELIKSLEERFSPSNQTELYRTQLRERRQKAIETLPELGQDVRRLANLAYPTAPNEVRETLAKEQFIDALIDVDMRLRIKQARPVNLNDAVRHAVELEAFNKAEIKKTEGKGYLRVASETFDSNSNISETLKSMQKTLTNLQNEVKSLKSSTPARPEYRNNSKQNLGSSDYKCYVCGKSGHMKRNCPQRPRVQNSASSPKRGTPTFSQSKNSGKNPAYKTSATVGVHKLSAEAGMFVKAKVNGVVANLLIDTGATVTIINTKLYKQMSNVSLSPSQREILTANGESLQVMGKTIADFEFENFQCSNIAVIANINVDGIVGLDFMRAHSAAIDIERNIITVQGQEINVQIAGQIGCYRVVVSETVTLPPRTESIVNGQVENSAPDSFKVGLVEPTDDYRKTEKALVGRALVSNDKTIPLRLMNISAESQTLYGGTVIAKVSPVDDIPSAESTLIEQQSQESSHVQVSSDVPDHLINLYETCITDLSASQIQKVQKLLNRYADIFSKHDADYGRTSLIKHQIEIENAKPFKEPPRRVPYHLQEDNDKAIEDMLAKNVIEPSSSPWAAGVVLVKKKDGSTRFCVDYRKLNRVTVKDAYPLPRIDDSLNQMSGAKWFSTLDLCSGYWQVEVEPKDRQKTAFATRKGLYQFQVMPFGLCNAPATFERLMETVLAGLQWDICLIYLDDVIVFGKEFEDMIENLSVIFERLLSAGLKLKPKKCTLFARKVEYLGHVVSENGISTDPRKVGVVKTWPEPANITELRSFLGFCSYYRRYIEHFAEIAKPLHKLTQKDTNFGWSDSCQQAFETLKYKLVSAPILAHPDFKQSFILDTDASGTSIGAVLSQIQDGHERVISYASRRLTKSERRYCVTRKELLAVVFFTKYFKHYLLGRKFLIRTDHSSLRWLLNFKNPDGQMARWLEILYEFDMDIQHRPGTKHGNADSLSRMPCRQCEHCNKRRDKQAVHSAVEISPSKSDEQVSLLKAQQSDRDIQVVKGWVENEIRPSYDEIKKEGFVVKSLWGQWKNLIIEDGLLSRKLKSSDSNIEQLQALVPQSHRRKVLFYCHDIRSSGHLGIKKTLSKIRQKYYWPGLRNDVRSYIAGCDPCWKRKRLAQKNRSPMQVVRSGVPMERIATDILGELPETENGNKYILVVSDYFTKWTEAFPMRNMEAETVASIIVEEVIARFGVPQVIHSDQGKQYESRLFQEMCKVLHITKTRTTAYHPQSDGMVERFNGTLETMLSAYVQENHRDWDKHLPYVMMAYRASEHETTGFSPNMLMLGRETSTPLDLIYEMPSSIKQIPSNMWVWELKERLEIAHSMVRKHSENAILRQKTYHDHKMSWQQFKPTDLVYVYFPQKKVGCTPKFTSFWRGPFQITRKLSEVLYEVNCGRDGQRQIIHCDRLRRKIVQNLSGENDVETSVEDELDKVVDDLESENLEEVDDLVQESRRPKRVGKRPVRYDDYVCENNAVY